MYQLEIIRKNVFKKIEYAVCEDIIIPKNFFDIRKYARYQITHPAPNIDFLRPYNLRAHSRYNNLGRQFIAGCKINNKKHKH